MTDPQKDEHIEELLSKLQGIFGKLSHSEEEEAKQTVDIPVPAAAPAPVQQEKKEPISLPELPAPVTPPPPIQTAPVPDPAPKPPEPIITITSSYESMVPLEDSEKMIVPTSLYFPLGRDTEAKAVAQKLETITPKFTKIAFRLRVGVFMPYDPKSEWKDTIAQKAAEVGFRTAFVLMDRPLDDVKRKLIAGELEERGVYFQEVLTASIEKKAFYTDVLLGLVFFFDSHKPSTESPKADGTAT